MDFTETLSARVKKLRQHLNDVLEQETEATDERIERYAKQQTALLKIFCEKSKQDYDDILSALDDMPCDLNNTDGTNDTLTNAKLLSNLTPPVTPDSTPMSIGNSPNFKHQTSFLLNTRNSIGSQTPIGKKLSNLNHSTPDKSYQLTNDINDDIFFDMDGLGNEINSHSNERNDYDSDNESNDDNADKDLGKYI